MHERRKQCYCGKGMCPALVRLINKERNRLGQRPLAPNERDDATPGVLLDELADLRKLPTRAAVQP